RCRPSSAQYSRARATPPRRRARIMAKPGRRSNPGMRGTRVCPGRRRGGRRKSRESPGRRTVRPSRARARRDRARRRRAAGGAPGIIARELPIDRSNRTRMATAATGRTKEPTSLSGLGRALVQHQLLRLDQASAIQRKADANKQSFVDELIGGGHMPARQLAQFAAELCGHPLLDLAAIDPATLPEDLLDRKLAHELRVIALGKRGGRLSIAVSDPTDSKVLDRIRFSAQAALDPIVVEHDRLVRLVERLGQSATEQLEDLVDESLDDIAVTGEEQAPAPDTSDVDDAPVVRFLQKVLIDAIQAGASDIHFEPYEKFYRIR